MSKTAFDHGLPMTLRISLLYPLGPAAVILMPLIVGGVVDHYGFSEQQAGLIASMEGLGLVLGLLVGAQWVRRLPWTRMLLIGLAAYSAVNLASAGIQGLAPLAGARLLAGFCGGSVFAVVNAALGDNRAPDRAFGIGQSVQGLMMFAAFAAAPLLPEGRLVESLFCLFAAAALLLMLCLLRFPDRGIEAPPAAVAEQSRSRRPLIWIGLLGGLLYYAGVFGFWDFLERIGLAAGLEPNAISLALGASQIAAVAGGILAAIASDRFGRIAPLALALTGQLAVLWLLAGQFALPSYVVGACLYQGLYIIATCYMLGVIAKLDEGGKYVVVMNAVLGVGVALGPSIAAALIRPGDYSGINLAAAIGILGSFLLFLCIAWRSRNIARQREPAPDPTPSQADAR